jgi:hypothetical protein
MAFVRHKRVGGKDYAQIVENYREDGKVRQRVLLHLGRVSPARALVEWQGYADQPGNGEETCRKYAAKVAALRSLVDEGKIAIPDEEIQAVEAQRAEALASLRRLEAAMRGC